MADAGHEPSMEDILSSIKRIIAEDSEAALSGPRVKRAVAGPAPAPRADPRPTPEPDILELTDPVAVELPPMPPPRAPEPVVAAPPAIPVDRAASAPVNESTAELVSPSTADASRSALAALSALVVKPAVAGSDSLEGLVREMLKPMLADWLDARLPEVVERLVAAEIRRITERG